MMRDNVRYHIFAYGGEFYIVINFYDEYKVYRKTTIKNTCRSCDLYDYTDGKCQIFSEEDINLNNTHLCTGGCLEQIRSDFIIEFNALVRKSIKVIENEYLVIDKLSATIESEYCKDICPYSGKCIPNCIKDLLIKKFNDKL